MKILRESTRAQWSELIRRPVMEDHQLQQRVAAILLAVRSEGDTALRRYAQQFDGAVPESLRVSLRDRDARAALVPSDLAQALSRAIETVSTFHSTQKISEVAVETAPGVVCSRRSVAIERVGIYIPGGTAPLFSTLVMLAVPARIAGCREIVLVTPGGKDAALNPVIALAARVLGIEEIYLVGGAQAVAALAYGTESIRPVHKIFGPGNSYVTEAKLQVAAQGVAIDMPAGPSEVLVIADDAADPEFIAADLLAQAEHGPDSQVVLVTPHEELLDRTVEQVALQCATLPRAATATEALSKSVALLVSSLEEAVAFSNLYAPEHLILNVRDPEALASSVVNAGSVFLGPWAAEALGDYASGTNHVLPTNGAAYAYSGVSVDSFVKKITFQKVSRRGLASLATTVVSMARAEGLEAHAQAVLVRTARNEEEVSAERGSDSK